MKFSMNFKIEKAALVVLLLEVAVRVALWHLGI